MVCPKGFLVLPKGLEEPEENFEADLGVGVVGLENVGREGVVRGVMDLDGVERGVGAVGRENVGLEGVDLPNDDRVRDDASGFLTDDLPLDEDRPRDFFASAKSADTSSTMAKKPVIIVIFECFFLSDMAGLHFHD